MKTSTVKDKMKRGENILCVASHYTTPAIIELIGRFGFDCLWICNEHIGINRETLENLIRAARINGMDAMVRIVRGNYDDFIQPLEMGAKGIMIPHVLTPEDAARIVADTKFPPQGHRGIDGVNPDADMGFMETKAYMQFSNENTFLVPQIESVEALGRWEEIAAVKGIDILFVGPADLSNSMGLAGEIQHPRVQEAIQRVARACEKNGIYCGTPGIDVEYSKRLLDMGVKFIAAGGDYGILRAGFTRLRENFEPLGFKLGSMGTTSAYAD